MKIEKLFGIEMEKETRTSFQDYFNESFMLIVDKGKEVTFSVVYLRYFEENIEEFTPFQNNPVCVVDEKEYDLKDLIAFIYFHQFPKERRRKRIYISDGDEFKKIFNGIDQESLVSLLKKLN